MTLLPQSLTKLIPSLGRENDNEVVAAARAIGAALKADKLDFHDFAQAIEHLTSATAPCRAAPFPASSRPTPTTPSGPGSWSARYRARTAVSDYDRAHWLVEYGAAFLNEREREFVHNLSRRLGRFGGKATYRQATWLNDLFARVARTAA